MLKQGILPEQDLIKNIIYHGRLIENSPEFMHMNLNLNQDLHVGVKTCCHFTNNLPKDGPKKVSLSTPKNGVIAYCRLWDPNLCPNGIPSSKRIM